MNDDDDPGFAAWLRASGADPEWIARYLPMLREKYRTSPQQRLVLAPPTAKPFDRYGEL